MSAQPKWPSTRTVPLPVFHAGHVRCLCGRESQETASELIPNSGRLDARGRIWRKAGGQLLVRVDSPPQPWPCCGSGSPRGYKSGPLFGNRLPTNQRKTRGDCRELGGSLRILAWGRTPAPSRAPLPACTLWPYFCAGFMRPAPRRAADAPRGPSFSGPWLGAGSLVSHHIVPAPIRESGLLHRRVSGRCGIRDHFLQLLDVSGTGRSRVGRAGRIQSLDLVASCLSSVIC